MHKHSTKTTKTAKRTPQKPAASRKDIARKAAADAADEFGRGLMAFAAKAYDEALDYYSKHHKNPAALAAFSRIKSDRERLGYAIEEILNNSETPERLYRDVGNFYCDIQNRVNHDTFPKILEALSMGECGFAGCPGATTDGGVCPGPESDHHKDEQLANLLFTDSSGPEKGKGVRA